MITSLFESFKNVFKPKLIEKNYSTYMSDHITYLFRGMFNFKKMTHSYDDFKQIRFNKYSYSYYFNTISPYQENRFHPSLHQFLKKITKSHVYVLIYNHNEPYKLLKRTIDSLTIPSKYDPIYTPDLNVFMVADTGLWGFMEIDHDFDCRLLSIPFPFDMSLLDKVPVDNLEAIEWYKKACKKLFPQLLNDVQII